MSTKVDPTCNPYCTLDIVSWANTYKKPGRAETLSQRIGSRDPSSGECARFEKRPLSWAVWLPFLSQNSTLDELNMEFLHEHLVFEDTGDNIGFGPHGYFSEDVDSFEYGEKSRCFDAEVMRKAIVLLERQSFSYNFFFNNCQDYAEALRDMYERLGGK